MQHTLIAVFDNRSDAQQALEDLVNSGFSRQEVRLSEGDPQGQASSSAAGTQDESVGSSIKHFFSDLFGTDRSAPAQMYTEAIHRGHYVLTLTAPSEPEVERAADIVERYGPIDIDEQAEAWRGDSSRSASGSQVQQQNLQSGQSASMQREGAAAAIPVIQEELKIGKREVERGGVRIFRHVEETPVNETIGLREEHVSVRRRALDQMVDPAEIDAFQESTIELRETAEEAVVQKSARVVEEVLVDKEVLEREAQISDTVRRTVVDVEQIAPADDTYYRGHWTSTFAGQGGRYEDYAPAYQYGSTMARSDLYRGRPWDEVESNLRTDWEARNPGSAWANFKAAVRHGWERITS